MKILAQTRMTLSYTQCQQCNKTNKKAKYLSHLYITFYSHQKTQNLFGFAYLYYTNKMDQTPVMLCAQ